MMFAIVVPYDIYEQGEVSDDKNGGFEKFDDGP